MAQSSENTGNAVVGMGMSLIAIVALALGFDGIVRGEHSFLGDLIQGS